MLLIEIIEINVNGEANDAIWRTHGPLMATESGQLRDTKVEHVSGPPCCHTVTPMALSPVRCTFTAEARLVTSSGNFIFVIT